MDPCVGCGAELTGDTFEECSICGALCCADCIRDHEFECEDTALADEELIDP